MIHRLLTDYKVILASASPRRKELFSLLGLQPLIFPAEIAEPLSDEDPSQQAMKHATNKALFVQNQGEYQSLIVAADTLVSVDRHVLGKPRDALEARDYLRLLSNRQHCVWTGLCLLYNKKQLCGYEKTEVSFAPLTDEEIESYIATYEPMDKAGAYGIQGYGAQFISKVNGCYFNVMGFPIHKFYDMLRVILAEEKS